MHRPEGDVALGKDERKRARKDRACEIEKETERITDGDGLCLSSAVLVKSPVERWTCSAD